MNEQYYNETYFEWQKEMGAFGGWADLIKFEDFITPDMNVIDFGCGGGFILNNLNCKNKIGIEINDIARNNAINLGIKAFKFSEDVPNNWADCIISNHALEHVPDPLHQILILKSKLKLGGKIIFVVPCDTIKYKFKPNDINNHLYSWSPMNLGNLFVEAGYAVIESKTYIHKWPPFHQQIARIFGKHIFNLICRIYGRIETSWYQIRIIAEKKTNSFFWHI